LGLSWYEALGVRRLRFELIDDRLVLGLADRN